jgi:hypothetical protein
MQHGSLRAQLLETAETAAHAATTAEEVDLLRAQPRGLSGTALIESVRAFAETLLIDMESEERSLLRADLDAIAVDGKGG